MTTVVLVHGWSYDASIWDAVRMKLPPDLTVATIDFGYFSSAVPPTPTFSGPVIAVGHSLGALWWLSQATTPWRRLLCINGFPRFCATTGYAPAVAPRVLARMRAQFEHDPVGVLTEFHARCGAPGPAAGPFSNPAVARLLAGLDALAEWDGRAMLAARHDDIYALAGTDDPIVPAAMSRAAFAALPPDHLSFAQAPGHLLPLTAPALCAAWIERLAT
jgi:pimeloyl-[acyl-carrier protein] methyl ester esterase